MLVDNHLDWPIRPEQQEAGGIWPPRQIGEQVQGGRITPVQILQH